MQPSKDQIPWSNEQQWRCLTEDLTFTVYVKGGEVYKYSLQTGMMTDFASIPRGLRGRRPWFLGFTTRIPDNDDPRIIIPSLIHDAGCSFKLFGSDRKGFHFNNDMFYALCRYYGLNRRQARILKGGVESPIGWKLYQNGRGYESFVRATIAVNPKEFDPESILDKACTFIKKWEGYKSHAYQCQAGVWTIGYGRTSSVKEGDTTTEENELKWLKGYVSGCIESVNNLVEVELSELKIVALASFVFNLGHSAFYKSTLLKKINSGKFEDIPNEFKKWVYAGGEISNGLINRRNAEVELWNVE